MAAQPTPKGAWKITALLFLYMVVNFADKIVVGLAGVPIMSDLKLTPQQFGFLGSAFFFLFSISAIAVGFVVNKVDYWTSHLRAVQAWATHFFAHRKLFIADSGNVLTIDKPVPLNDAQISATIFGLNGSPLMIGDDVDRMAPERLAMLRQQFPRLPEAGEPLDLFDAPEPDHVKTFRLRVKTRWDAWELFAVFNFSPEPLRKTLPAAGAVWDFWDERYTGGATGALDVIVPPRSVKLLRVAPARAHPWILSTDIHIRQGQAELSGVAWDEPALELRFTTARAGNVFLRVPKEFRLADPAGLWIAKDGNDASLIVRVAADSVTFRLLVAIRPSRLSRVPGSWSVRSPAPSCRIWPWRLLRSWALRWSWSALSWARSVRSVWAAFRLRASRADTVASLRVRSAVSAARVTARPLSRAPLRSICAARRVWSPPDRNWPGPVRPWEMSRCRSPVAPRLPSDARPEAMTLAEVPDNVVALMLTLPWAAMRLSLLSAPFVVMDASPRAWASPCCQGRWQGRTTACASTRSAVHNRT